MFHLMIYMNEIKQNMYIINVNYAYWFHNLDIHMETNGKQKFGGSFVFSRSKETDSWVSNFIYAKSII